MFIMSTLMSAEPLLVKVMPLLSRCDVHVCEH
jgi:hypothetical protein